ncbi:MAG: type VI secretion system baseplate subunit TssE [Rhizobiales bacterium]|nr:type VI secretion system baseplate subunit TssE [Hyphomicrobiales bacterium]
MRRLLGTDQLQPSLFDRLQDDVSGLLADLARERARLLDVLDADQQRAFAALHDEETGLMKAVGEQQLEPFRGLGQAGAEMLAEVIGLERRRLYEIQRNRAISADQLKEYVRRDLEALLNSAHLEASQPLADHPEVRRSTVNYGIRPLAGRIGASIDVPALETMLARAVRSFEPRIKNVEVRAVLDADSTEAGHLTFEIEGDVWGQTAPSRLVLRS